MSRMTYITEKVTRKGEGDRGGRREIRYDAKRGLCGGDLRSGGRLTSKKKPRIRPGP